MMARKNYEAAAALVACVDHDLARGTAITLLCRFFAADNSRFDRDRFIARVDSLRASKGW